MPSGGCFCGRVRYEAQAAPVFVCICHCESCRRACGAAPVAWVTVAASGVRFTGTLREHASSEGVTRGHCEACGTSLTYRNARRPGEIDLTLASFDDPAAHAPVAHIWVEDKPAWVTISDDLPQYPRTVTGA